jgi:hypothetical protein
VQCTGGGASATRGEQAQPRFERRSRRRRHLGDFRYGDGPLASVAGFRQRSGASDLAGRHYAAEHLTNIEAQATYHDPSAKTVGLAGKLPDLPPVRGEAMYA